ncbi:hypothetical protein LTR28_011665 [Elasticomyces elasticus]|nr:hypothetical protein LTR28_011665 [Elasticomyces elasticus]
MTADVAEGLKHSEDIDVDVVVEGVLQWLSLPSNQHWLLVIDNVDRDHLSKEKDPQAYDVKEYFPAADHGSILITSRLASLARYWEDLKVGKVDDNQAKNILENNAGKPIEDADLIITRLNGLPLALTQAGSYLRETNMETIKYIKYYDTTWKDLMEEQDEFPLQEYADRSVLTTWTISYKQVQGQNEEAAGLLKLWGFLDCGDLWYGLIANATASRLDGNMETPSWLQQLAQSERRFHKALRLLSRYSLVDAIDDTKSHSMHSVLHAWCCQLAEGGERRTLCWLAAGLVAEMVPSEAEPEYWKLRKRLLPHGSRVYRALDEEWPKHLHEVDEPAVSPGIFFQLGVLLTYQTKLCEAEKMFMQALAGYEKAFGAEHISTLGTVDNLGILYAYQGKLDEAVKMYVRALAGKEKALGIEHTSTLNTVNNLGALYRDQGKLDEAEKLYYRALVGQEKALGIEHTSTLNSVNNLGLLYAYQGKRDEAEKMLLRARVGKERALGIEHISTLRTVNNLGLLYADQGKRDEAEKMLLRALVGKGRHLAQSTHQH